jgi:hypothetical protein
MTLHLIGIAGIAALTVLAIFSPFLPGGYDGFAVLLSTTAQLIGGSKRLSENRLTRGGQAHFAPKTPQNEPVPDGFRIASKRRGRIPRVQLGRFLGNSGHIVR